MSTNNNPELELLKQEVSRIYGGKISTSNDFAELSESISASIGQMISDSTLKRIWGYVNYNPQPHTTTLNLLAKYVGHSSFREFCNANRISSAFFSCNRIDTADLEKGDKILLGWNPDREVILQYQGDLKFTVIDAGTSKLQEGDIVESSEFLNSVPCFFGKVIRGDQTLPAYVAGKSMGLSKLEMVY